MVALAYASGPSPTEVVAFLLIATGASALYSLVRIGIEHVDLAAVTRPDLSELRRLTGFGIQGEAGNVLQMLNYRLDQYIVRGFVSLAGVGIYAVGVSMTEAVFVLANAVALVLMPRLAAADEEEAAWMAPVAARNTILIASGGALLLAAIAPALIPAVFGDAYDDSVRPLWWLLPGTVALAGSKVLTSYIFSRGRPLVNTMITAGSLVVTLVADLALVPAFGVEGAAAASSLAYGAHLCGALYAYHRISGRPALDALLPRPSDAQLYADAVRGVVSRAMRRTPAGAGG
jgi:O-antigen/teichoic acid export membrane protein